jgi:preprotein translocase subunit SecD
MLYFTRWKAAAIVLTALLVCLFAVPNFFPEKTVQSWPKWAQRHMVLGLDLQGGSHILLEVDTKTVRKDMLETLRDDVRRVLRDARVGYTGLAVRGNGVEVRVRDTASLDNALTKLRELSLPLGGMLVGSGQRSLDINSEADGLVRLTVTDPAVVERVRQSVEQSIQIIERRVNELGTVEPLIQRQGTDRILVQVPGLQDPTRLKELLGKTAKLDFRMVDTNTSVEAALQGRAPPESEVLYSTTQPRRRISSRSGWWCRAPNSPMRSPVSISAPANRSSRSASIPAAPASSRRRRRKTSASLSPSFSTMK